MRPLLLGVALLAAGCSGGDPVGPAAAPPVPVGAVSEFDFAGWPSATREPVPVPAAAVVLSCTQPTPTDPPAGTLAPLPGSGVHAGHAIVVRVSPEAFADFMARKPLPVGAVVVKEKHPLPDGSGAALGPLTGYTAMRKREAGYDPDNGDWEYVDATRAAGPVLRGRLSACVACHASERDGDFLFRDYLPGGR